MSAAATCRGINALVALDPYLTALGLAAEEAEELDGKVIVALPPLDRHIAIPEARLLHGGVIAAFLEATASLTLRECGDVDVRTVEFTTDFLRPVPLAATRAFAVVIRQGRRFASVRVEAWQSVRGRLVAVGHGRFVVTPKS